MKYPKANKQLIVTVTGKQKKMLIEASEKSLRPVTSIAREGAMIVAKKILSEVQNVGESTRTN